MDKLLQVLLIITTGTLTVVYSSIDFDSHDRNITSCPTWQFYNITSKRCDCGDDIHESVWCNETTNDVRLLDCYCMTLNQTDGQLKVGKCFIGCEHSMSRRDVIYNRLPQNKQKLNDWLCKAFNKNRTFCGACHKGYSRVVYSYDLNCRKCTSSYSQNIAKFVIVTFGPLTLFYILVVVFKVSATSPHLNSYILFSQWISEPISVRIILRMTQKFPKLDIFARILTSAYGIWNLDFFRPLYPPTCLDVPRLMPLALDYTGAFYSLFLILLTYLLMKLYSQDVRVLVYLWKPIQCVLTYFDQLSGTKLSMVDVFSTFFLLSYIKILSVSFTLLVPTTIYNIHGNESDYFLYYDASIKYFSREHLPYWIIAIIMTSIFTVIPSLFLTLYPFKWFQRCLNKCRITHQAIHTFADCYLGRFKDGTEQGTRDCRFVVSLYLALRMYLFIFYGFSLSVYTYAFAAVFLIMFAVVLSLLKPYKHQWAKYNTIDPSMILLVAMWYGSIICIEIATEKAFQFLYVSIALCSIICAFPLLCITGVLVLWFIKHSTQGMKVLTEKVHNGRKEYYETLEDVPPAAHRMEHPEQYT